MNETKLHDKRDEILDVAERLFAEQGFEAVSVREISKAADINIAMISYYFGSKEKLYESVLDRKFIPLHLLFPQLEKLPTYTQKLLVFIDIFTDGLIERRQFQNIIFREVTLNQRTGMTDKIVALMQQNFQFIADIIHKGIKNKEFKKVDVELTVLSIIGIIRMYVSSGTIACKILNADSIDTTVNAKNKTRFKKHLRELISNHLLNTN